MVRPEPGPPGCHPFPEEPLGPQRAGLRGKQVTTPVSQLTEPWLYCFLFFPVLVLQPGNSPGRKVGPSWGPPCLSSFPQRSLSGQRV